MSITIATDKTYEDLINNEFTILDFYSTSCTPCKAMSIILDDFSDEYPFINIVKVNSSDYPAIARPFNLVGVPTIVFMKNGIEVDREVGLMSQEEVFEKVSKYYYGE